MLKAEQIVTLLKRGAQPETEDPFIITPSPNLEEIGRSGSTSIDLRLGTWFITPRQARMTHLPIGSKTPQSKLVKTHYVPFGSEYQLHPRSFVLGITLEWLRLPKNIAGYLIGRSSWGRRGLIIATAAGVHPGFKGCLTLELSNVGEIPLTIAPGLAICQLCLHSTEEVTDTIDCSKFVGHRKPILGEIELDPIAKKLAEAFKGE